MPDSHYYYSRRYRMTKREKVKKILKHLFFNKVFFALIIFIVFFSGVFYCLFFLPYFQITEVEISGIEKIKNEEIREFVQEKIKNKIIFFETTSYFSVDADKIKSELNKQFYLIRESKIKKKFPQTLVVFVVEKKPAIVLCKDGTCFNLDALGIPYEIAEKPMFLINLSSEISLGKAVMDEKYFKELIDFKKQQENFSGISIKEINFQVEQGIIELIENEGWKAMFILDDNISSQFNNLNIILNQKIPKDKRGNLEYIDLKFGNNVIFKYKSKPVEEVIKEKPVN